MALLDDVLAEIQDGAARDAVKNLPAGVLAAFEKRAALAEDARQKLGRLQAAEQELAEYRQYLPGWRQFTQQWEGEPGKDNGIKHELSTLRGRANREQQLMAEIAKLKPEADRAALLASQNEGDVVDPNKIRDLVVNDLKSKGETVTKAQLEEAVRSAVTQAQQTIADRHIPAVARLMEGVMRAKNDFDMNITTDDLASAMQKYPNLPFEVQYEKGFADVTAKAAEARAAKVRADAEAAHKAEVDAARREGAETARREYETAHIQGEDAGSGSILGIASLNSPPAERKGVDPTTYDKSSGSLAAKYMPKFRSLEKEGLYKLATGGA